MSSTTHNNETLLCEGFCDADIAGGSDIGMKRESNQDHFLIADLQRTLTIRSSNVPHEECQQLTGSNPGLLLVVADGMGGHQGGELASSTAIECSARYVLDMMHWFLKLSRTAENDFIDELSDCLKSIQRTIWRKSDGAWRKSDGAIESRMGTTVTMAYIIDDRMYVVHAGDSRCYLFRDGELKQLTTDHTLAQRLVEDGALTPEDAESSRWRHVLWNCVGGSDKTVQPEVTKVKLREDDVVMLCSDGLTGMVADEEIRSVLVGSGSSSELTAQLIDLANSEGGDDNITVVTAKKIACQKTSAQAGAEQSQSDTI